MLSIPLDVRFDLGQSVPNYFKSITNFMSYQTQKSGSDIIIKYYSIFEGKPSYKSLTYEETDRIVTNLACKWYDKTKDIESVAYLAGHDALYLIVMLTLFKLRKTMLPISPRNSELSVINLLQKTNSKLLIASEMFLNLANSSASKIPGTEVFQLPEVDLESLSKEPLNPRASKLLDTKFSDDDVDKAILILHSSGSTGLPKPIYISNRFVFNLMKSVHVFRNSRNDDKPFIDKEINLACVPLFHVAGIYNAFSMICLDGCLVFLGKFPCSNDDLAFALSYNKCTIMGSPPFLVEQLMDYINQTGNKSCLSSLKYISYGGAALENKTREWVYSQDIRLLCIYGSTEIGAALGSDTDITDIDGTALMSLSLDENGDSNCIFETVDDSDPDKRHLYIRAGSPSLAMNICNRPDGGFSTNDLFKVDHRQPGKYIYLGRQDDILVLENGEKTNPIPMEDAIRLSPLVKQVIVVGRNRQCTACLISIDVDHAMSFSPKDIIATVHDLVKEANKECSNHSTILPEMVEILPFNRLIPSTDKGTVMRKKAELELKVIIDNLYNNLSKKSITIKKENEAATKYSSKQIKDFLAENAAKILNKPISTFKDHDQSLFNLGFNSISSIQLRNLICEYFRSVPQNFIFQYPSINSMCDFLTSDAIENASEQIEQRFQQTQALAEEYIKKANKDFSKAAKNRYNKDKPKVVFLTGATGSLGSFILYYLLSDYSVKKVYCAVRGKEKDLFSRLVESFQSRSLDISLLKHADRVEAVAMKFNEPYLGFGKKRYQQLKKEVTIIQHCAWLLDFNMPIDHFDKECIAPFYNLLKFGYKDVDPMHVHFISSISASVSVGDEIKEVPLPFDSHVAAPMGYAQSKFIIEMLFHYLYTEKNYPCYIERVGQVCGDSQNGIWNASEQYPLMFIGGSRMRKMPKFDTVVDWTTVDFAAASIANIMNHTAYLPSSQKQSVFHIVNPHRIYWSDILDAMRNSGMQFEVVTPSEWIDALLKDENNPAFRLISFYEDNFRKGAKMPIWKTEATERMTPIIGKSPVIDTKLFSKFLKHWEAIGFYKP